MLILERFQPVADKFFALTTEQPYGGAALCVYQHGKPVLDIWAGEQRPGVLWQENTKSVVFSTSKGLLSIIGHHLIQQGLLDPDEKVAHYWPEFAANGKEKITVAMIMRHRSGLSAVREDITFEDMQKVTPVEDALARQVPIWQPDTGFLYHAGTIGHLLGKIYFNITGKRLNQLLQEIIATPLGVDAYFGSPADIEEEISQLKSDDAPLIDYPFESPLYWNRRAMTFGKAFTGHVDDLVGGYNDPRTQLPMLVRLLKLIPHLFKKLMVFAFSAMKRSRQRYHDQISVLTSTTILHRIQFTHLDLSSQTQFTLLY
jgi:CubicO group peptidase (beta-lactamase class C family)